MANKITFLGTGTSQGIPVIGCTCPVCLSSDSRDKRLRTSAFIEYEGLRIIIDAGPDFRQQLLANNISEIDGIILTHSHKDHTGGLDDIRAFNYNLQKDVPVYCEQRVLESLEKQYYYAFEDHKYPGVPMFDIRLIDQNPFKIKGVEIIPVRAVHYRMPVLGYRFGDLGYLTDASAISDESVELFKGVKVFVISTIRREPHISHFTLDQALQVASRTGAFQVYLTHISHQLEPYAQLSKNLPEGVLPAYDGLQVS
ncbi:MAG: MBL fold metallo-hydrolase, partial [Candidatus Coprenecus sp.]|nr:MBL fold metallo-hydrolase [Candidatus Coprenecus sp.]